MFATHNNQENFVHGHQQAAVSKPLNQGTRGAPPKTPGNKYPKTPLRIPLNDENAHTGYVVSGKSILGTKKRGNENLMTGAKKGSTFERNDFVTPMGQRTRAPLGMKTTNAKTKGFKTPGLAEGKEVDKTQPVTHSSARRPKKITHTETVKLEIHGDDVGPLDVPDVEYAPPKPAESPYESDVFPDGCLNYDVLKGDNLMRGFQQHFSNPVDENGVSKKQKAHEKAMAKALKEAEAKILKAIEDEDWSVGDVPETWPEHKQPKKPAAVGRKPVSTFTARRAANALSMPPPRPATALSKTTAAAEKPKFSIPFMRCKQPATVARDGGNSMSHAAAVAASRTTIGYGKSRVLFSATRPPVNRAAISRPSSTASDPSLAVDSTTTPDMIAQKQAKDENPNLAFLKAFDREDDEFSHGLGDGGLPESVMAEEEEEEFVLTLNLK